METIKAMVVLAESRKLGRPVPINSVKQVKECDHSDSVHGQFLARFCYECGVRLFLPPNILAFRSDVEISTMLRMWRQAGYPEWNGSLKNPGWLYNDYWKLVQHPLFEKSGGIPVLKERFDDLIEYWSD